MEGGIEGQRWKGGKIDSIQRKVFTSNSFCDFLGKMLASLFGGFTTLKTNQCDLI